MQDIPRRLSRFIEKDRLDTGNRRNSCEAIFRIGKSPHNSFILPYSDGKCKGIVFGYYSAFYFFRLSGIIKNREIHKPAKE